MIRIYCHVSDGQGNSVHQNHENKLDLNIQLQDLCPPALQALHEIVSLIHEGVNAPNQQCSSTSHTRVISNFDHNNTGIMKSFTLNADIQQDQFTSTSDSGVVSDKDSKNLVIANFYRLEDDSIANIIWNLEPLDLVAAFLAMVVSFFSCLYSMKPVETLKLFLLHGVMHLYLCLFLMLALTRTL